MRIEVLWMRDLQFSYNSLDNSRIVDKEDEFDIDGTGKNSVQINQYTHLN